VHAFPGRDRAGRRVPKHPSLQRLGALPRTLNELRARGESAVAELQKANDQYPVESTATRSNNDTLLTAGGPGAPWPEPFEPARSPCSRGCQLDFDIVYKGDHYLSSSAGSAISR
jgi:hypothetical protein